VIKKGLKLEWLSDAVIPFKPPMMKLEKEKKFPWKKKEVWGGTLWGNRLPYRGRTGMRVSRKS